MLIVTTGLFIAGLVYFAFVLIPLTFAYFFTFLVALAMGGRLIYLQAALLYADIPK